MTKEYKIKNSSGIIPIEAGYGLVYTDTIVATTTDRLIIDSQPSARIELEAGGKTSSGSIAELALSPGIHDVLLKVSENNEVTETKSIKLLIADPSGIVRKFGARYGSLEYDHPVVIGKGGRTAPWESLWKTCEISDIVVDFDLSYKFVLWRGMSYAPSWAADNVMTSLFFAETLEPGVYRDCCEMMSDRECRYSHARIIQNTDARVVIHWRYALSDSAYAICRDQWVDEMYYIYPDGIVCRNVTVYIDPHDEKAWKDCAGTGKRLPNSLIGVNNGGRSFNHTEFISVNPAGMTPDESLMPGAMTLMDSENFSEIYTWPSPPDFQKTPLPKLNEYIFRINYQDRQDVFVASHKENMVLSLNPNMGAIYEAGARVEEDNWRFDVPTVNSSIFGSFSHWPVTRGYGTTALTDAASFSDRPTHTFLGAANNAPIDVSENGAATWVWLTGIVPENEGKLRGKVKAWTRPVDIAGAKYNFRQRAYEIENAAGEIEIKINSGSEIVQPSFILKSWESVGISVLENGIRLSEDAISVGIERYMDKFQTIVTFRKDLQPGSSVLFKK